MATSFSKIKKGLGLLDIIQIGKYKGCRVDSIIEQDDSYLRYMQTEKILVFDKSVMYELSNKFATDTIATEKTRQEAEYNLDHYGIASLFPTWKKPTEKNSKYYPDSLDQINGFQSGRPSYIFSDMEDDIPF